MLTTDSLTSARMSRTRGRDNLLERRLRSALFERGLRFRVQYPAIDRTRRTIDIAFTKKRVAVFVDGCFWHGCPLHRSWPKRNSEFWRDKIDTNIVRDRDTNRRLANAGWTVIRIWAHQSITEAVVVIESALKEAKSGSGFLPVCEYAGS